jgi:hypothetical protein
MIYLTYNDSPSGIYNSQVIDVVDYLNTLSSEKIKLIALISIRNFSENKKKIKSRCPDSIVIPMIPKASNWKWNSIILFFCLIFRSHHKLISRGPFATHLAFKLKKMGLRNKVIFDGRGAYEAELNEYHVIEDKTILNEIKELEKECIHLSDYKIAVSNALVNYWKTNYNYNNQNHVVIPCTLSKDFIFEFPSKETIQEMKKEMGYKEDDIIFTYSGSAAGWQSFDLIDDLMCEILKTPKTKLIILSNHFDESFKVVKKYPKSVSVLFVEPSKVKNYLLISDYGILYREKSVTNQVASPVKFAEYLSCGLKILISDNLGDYTDFSKNENLLLDVNAITSVDFVEKKRIHHLSVQHFKKERYQSEYLTILNS